MQYLDTKDTNSAASFNSNEYPAITVCYPAITVCYIVSDALQPLDGNLIKEIDITSNSSVSPSARATDLALAQCAS